METIPIEKAEELIFRVLTLPHLWAIVKYYKSIPDEDKEKYRKDFIRANL